MNGEPLLIRFINECVAVTFDRDPVLEKRPHCPNAFIWQGETHRVAELISEWFDHTRRGRMARNMREAHARRAAVTGSWGVGRYYFRVRTEAGRVFDLYYDRAPAGAGDRKGHWFLFGERQSEAGSVDPSD